MAFSINPVETIRHGSQEGAAVTRWPKLAAIAVVPHDGKLLLVRRRNEPDAGLWGFPGGHVDAGETALRAAERELLEETGVVAAPTEYLTNIDAIVRDADGAVRFHYLLATVLCAYRHGVPRPMDDVTDARWFSYDDVLTKAIRMSADVDTVLRLALVRVGA